MVYAGQAGRLNVSVLTAGGDAPDSLVSEASQALPSTLSQLAGLRLAVDDQRRRIVLCDPQKNVIYRYGYYEHNGGFALTESKKVCATKSNQKPRV